MSMIDRYRKADLLAAIRDKCLYCKDTPNNVRSCPCKLCPLYPLRYEKEPRRAGKGAGT